jgi:sugar phosphate isomerase/epimerase
MMSQRRIAYVVCTPDCGRTHPLAYDAPFGVALEEIAELGYDGVELQVRDPADLDAQQLARQLASHGLSVVGLATAHVAAEDGLRLDGSADVRRRAITRLAAVIDLAAEFDALITIGSVRGAPADAKAAAAATAAIGELATHAARTGVRLGIEPQNRFAVGSYLLTVAEVADLIEASGWASVGIVADTFHMGLEERSMTGALVRAGTRLWHVQFGENHRRALGTGTLPLVEILDTLDALGYAGWLGMEHQQDGGSRWAASQSRDAIRVASNAGDLPS